MRPDHIYSTFMGSSYASDQIYSTFMGSSYAIRSYMQYIYGKFLCVRSDIQYIYGKFFCDQIIDTVHVCEVHMRSDHIYSTVMGSSYAIRSYIQFM